MNRRLANTLILLSATLFGAVAFVLWAPPLRGLRTFVRANMRETVVTGQVLSLTDDTGIPGSKVEVGSIGYDVMHWWEFGVLIRDSTVTDANGQFTLSLRVVGRPDITASHDGYTTIHSRPDSLANVIIRMIPLTASDEETVGQLLSLNYQFGNERFAIALDPPRLVDMSEADVSVAIQGTALQFQGHQGCLIQFQPGDVVTTGAYDVYANGCMAPDSGYSANLSLPYSSPPGLVFVRDRKHRFGSIAISAEQFQQMDSIHVHIVTVPVRFNESGARGLCTPRLQGVYDR